jgi:hypothetical protein
VTARGATTTDSIQTTQHVSGATGFFGQKVGIGTNSPTSLLHVANAGGDATLEIEAGNTSSSILRFGDTDNNDVGQIEYDHADNSLRFYNNNTTEKMRITSAGNVGIGTTNPATKLSVSGGDIATYNRDGTSRVIVSEDGSTTFNSLIMESDGASNNTHFYTDGTSNAMSSVNIYHLKLIMAEL